MNDFEVHERGTARELRLSRELTDEIRQVIESYGEGIIPLNVLQAYKRLLGEYMHQRNKEEI
jgi:hypothetical protein